MPHFSLTSPQWLQTHQDVVAATVLDTRPAADYWSGHLPGALHLDASLLTLPRTDAASIARFQALLGFALSGLGLRADAPVLVYGQASEVNVSRAAWALAYAGVQQIALLDGGLKANPDLPLSTEARPVTAVRFAVQAQPQLLATAEELLAPLPGTAVIDSRERAEFLGERSNARRHGRIPGALHWDTAAEVDGAARLQRPAALVALGAPARRRIVYCGGGGRAARSFIALQLAGQTDVAVYPGSWNEWGNQDSFPVESGEPQITAA